MKIAMNRRPELVPVSSMRHLQVGNQLFHNGVPVQLLYRASRTRNYETWRVRPLFVAGPDRDEQFSSSDPISFLHTMRASCFAA